MNNLPEIKDLQIPDGVSVFPVAYGWWVVLSILIAGAVLFKIIRHRLQVSKRRYALKEVENIDIENPVAAAVYLSELLRRVCLLKYKEASTFSGEEWISFLNKHSSFPLGAKPAKLLSFAPFMNRKDMTYSAEDAKKLKQFCLKWIGENL